MKQINPAQISTSPRLKKSTNFFYMQMLKHDGCLSEFHSRSELYFAALLEADPTVERYVPQPFAIPTPSGKYQPDVWIKRITGQEIVCEVTTPARSKGRPVKAASCYLEAFNIKYRLIETPAIFERALEAENWLVIIRHLARFRNLDLAETIDRVESLLDKVESAPISYLISQFRDINEQTLLAAVFRVLHEGRFAADLTEKLISMDTEVSI